jgi:hypothetical protein
MSLVDTTDGLVGACGWALVKPLRKLIYNHPTLFFARTERHAWRHQSGGRGKTPHRAAGANGPDA